MKITDECKMHLQTADLLLQGIKESILEFTL